MMSDSRLNLRDVRQVFRLIGDIRERGADPDCWRPHMVGALRKMLAAQIVVSSEIHFQRSGPRGDPTMRVIDIGWISDADGTVVKAATEREGEQPEDFWLCAGATPQAITEASERDGELVPVIPTRKLYAGKSFILSQVALPHVGTVDQLGLHRAWGDEPFTRAHHRLVRLLHVELGRLWRRDALHRAQDPCAALPPRLSQTLDQLLVGKSEKEIALQLDLSRHTIHNYVKALHQRFGVSSRGELLAKAGREKSGFTPQLTIDLPPRN